MQGSLPQDCAAPLVIATGAQDVSGAQPLGRLGGDSHVGVWVMQLSLLVLQKSARSACLPSWWDWSEQTGDLWPGCLQTALV